MDQVLKLNSAMLPIEIIDWCPAVDLWLKGKAEILSVYDKVIHGGWRFKDLPSDLFYRYMNVDPSKRIRQIYDDRLESWQTAMHMPAVIRMINFVKPPKDFSIFKPFNRDNIWIRDGGICQYCGEKVSKNQFTYDHVFPQSKGGPTCWTNIVCTCQTCNNKKRNRTPEEAGMKLIRKPFAPIAANDYCENVSKKFRSMTKRLISIKEWQSYIYWNVELEHDKE